MSVETQANCINHLKHHVETLADEIGERHVRKHAALHEAANYISQQWENMGYEVTRQPFKTKGVECENLEISRIGKTRPEDIILICANYDSSKDCPGANGNSSGVAAMLEISRCFSQLNPGLTVRFVALANENPPYFGTEKSGSWIYAHQARKNCDKIHTAIMIESIGYYNNSRGSQLYPALMGALYPKQANFLAMTSNLRSMTAMRRFARLFKYHSTFRCEPMIAPNFLPWVRWSDNSPFWLSGYRAFMVSDTSPYRYPFHHSSRDTSEKLDYDSLNVVTHSLIETIKEYARCE